MPTNDFLPIATDVGAYVDDQVTYAGSGYQLDGLQPGLTLGRRLNKMIRQGSVGSAVLGNLVVALLGLDFLDDGDLTTQTNRVKAMIQSLAAAAANPQMVTVPWSATPVFDCTAGNLLHPVFRIRLTGDVTSSTLTGVEVGMFITILVEEDGAGGHAFVPPANMPLDAIDTTANQQNVQSFHVVEVSNLNLVKLIPAGPMVLGV